jgi:UDP-GlcNAc3NAcA epimerase
MKVVSIVGTRPQLIKAAALSPVLRQRHEECFVDTGQHYDETMAGGFFAELGLPRPDVSLGVGGGTHAEQTGRMLRGLEEVLAERRPDAVVIYGDTNSTLAGALAAAKLNIPVAHVEAGLRSFNRRMPEETNRIVTDRLAALHFCPTQTAVDNLRNEGLGESAELVGDVMFDVAKHYAARAENESRIAERLGLNGGAYVLATCHRAESTDCRDGLREIVAALTKIADQHTVIWPVHPRTTKALESFGLADGLGKVRAIAPVSFLDMIALERHARVIVTDSGGVQKEAFFYGVPCVTLRDETEWVETVALGRNHLAGRSADRIGAAVAAAMRQPIDRDVPNIYGDGDAARRIESRLAAF